MVIFGSPFGASSSFYGGRPGGVLRFFMKYFLVLALFSLLFLLSACRQAPPVPPVLIHQHYTLTGAGSCGSNRGVTMSVAHFLLRENTD